MNNEFCTMKEIGQAFGVTSHAIGKRLKEIGLRTMDGKPSREAFDEGYCEPHWTHDGKHYCWAWDKSKTMALLEASGLSMIKRDEPP